MFVFRGAVGANVFVAIACDVCGGIVYGTEGSHFLLASHNPNNSRFGPRSF